MWVRLSVQCLKYLALAGILGSLSVCVNSSILAGEMPVPTASNDNIQLISVFRLRDEDIPSQLAFSDISKSLYLVIEDKVYKLDKEIVEKIVKSGLKEFSGYRQDMRFQQLFEGEVEDFILPANSYRAAWLMEDELYTYDVAAENIENHLVPSTSLDSIIEVHLNADGKKLLMMQEIDKEKESLLLYEWRVYDSDTGKRKKITKQLTISPDSFVGWTSLNTGLFSNARNSGYTVVNMDSPGQKVNVDMLPDKEIEIGEILLEPKSGVYAMSVFSEEDCGIYVGFDPIEPLNKKKGKWIAGRNIIPIGWQNSGRSLLYQKDTDVGVEYYDWNPETSKSILLLRVEYGKVDDIQALLIFQGSLLVVNKEAELQFYKLH